MPLVCKIICTDNNGKIHHGVTRDINTFGVYVEMTNSLAVHTYCELKIVIEGMHSQLIIESLPGKIARKDNNGIAVIFRYDFEWLPLVPLLNNKIQVQRREK